MPMSFLLISIPIQVLQEKQGKFNIFLLGILLGLVIPQFVSAQNNFQKELSWGLNGGISISSVNFINPGVRQNSLLRGVGGVSLRYISENNFGIQCEINYSQRGWQEVSLPPQDGPAPNWAPG